MNAENSLERSLGTIAEDEDTPNSEGGSKTDLRKDEGVIAKNDEVFDSKDKENNQGLNEEQLAVLSMCLCFCLLPNTLVLIILMCKLLRHSVSYSIYFFISCPVLKALKNFLSNF